jgi:hypothetical protein
MAFAECSRRHYETIQWQANPEDTPREFLANYLSLVLGETCTSFFLS